MFRFKNFGHLDTAPKPTGDAIVDKLSDIVAIESLSDEDRTEYDRNMRNEFDIRTEKLMIREAAFSEGIAEGKAETRLEVARKLLAAGIDISVIAESTGLSREELEAI